MSAVSDSLRAVTSGQVLSAREAEAALGEIMGGGASPVQVAGLLCALRTRGESVEEITGFVNGMRGHMVRVSPQSSPLVDTCGTGGDASAHSVATFNISTAASFIAAGAGAIVAKHGNRAISSRTGSSDVLEALGVNLHLSPEQIARCVDQVGIGFMFAPNHHPAMAHAAPIRRELGIRTIFNLVGPLSNPADATRRMVGVSEKRWILPIAQVLAQLGVERAIVCHGRDGMDEFSTCAPTDYVRLENSEVSHHVLDPSELSVACANVQVLAGGDAAHNASVIRALLDDEAGAHSDIACLNAAAILLVAGRAEDFEDGLKLARSSVASGAARDKLAHVARLSNEA
jgi:anthranilate phosphoribosyltransferase